MLSSTVNNSTVLALIQNMSLGRMLFSVDVLGNLNLIPNNGYLLSQKVREGGRLAVQIAKLQNQIILVKLDLNITKFLKFPFILTQRKLRFNFGNSSPP